MKGKIIKFVIVVVVIAFIVIFNVMMNSTTKIKHEEAEEHDHGGGPKIMDATLDMGKVCSFETDKGSFDVVLLERDIRNSTRAFKKLAGGKKYDGIKFTEVKDWMIKSDFAAADMTPLDNETANGLMACRGAVCLAKGNKSHKSVSSFFIIKETSPSVIDYFTIIGYVVKGMDTVDKIAENDTIKSVKFRKATSDDEKELIAVIKNGTKDSKILGPVSAMAQQKMMEKQAAGAPTGGQPMVN